MLEKNAVPMPLNCLSWT